METVLQCECNLSGVRVRENNASDVRLAVQGV